MSGTVEPPLRPAIAICEHECAADGESSRTFDPRYAQADVLLRFDRTPVGVVRVDLRDGRLQSSAIQAALDEHPAICERIERLKQQAHLIQQLPSPPTSPLSWSLIICTRDRTEDLGRCLDAVMKAEGIKDGEVIIVDNAPSSDATRELVKRYPVRYLHTPRGGQNHARALGAHEALGQVLLFTDDDVRIDRGWIQALLKRFDAPRVGAVTGLTLPIELETEAQHFFRQYGGHGQGYEERSVDRNSFTPAAAGRLGNGANMAIRRELVVGMNVFEVELDGGTAAMSGGDTYALYRILAAGYLIRYTPQALVWHRDRRDLASLQRMLYGYSVGVFAFLLRTLHKHRETDALWVGGSWLLHHHFKQTLRSSLRRPGVIPFALLWPELKGVATAPWAYWKTLRMERDRRRGITP